MLGGHSLAKLSPTPVSLGLHLTGKGVQARVLIVGKVGCVTPGLPISTVILVFCRSNGLQTTVAVGTFGGPYKS